MMVDSQVDVLLQAFSRLWKYGPIGMAFVNLDGTIARVNPALCRIWQRSEAELLAPGFNWPDITPQADLIIDMANLKELTEGRTRFYTMPKDYYAPDKSLIHTRLTVVPVHDDQRELICYAVLVELRHSDGTTEELRRKTRDKEIKIAELARRIQERLEAGIQWPESER